jgi:YVTN family beta-propeller protein/VCBS repeat-containing protein
VTVAPSTNAAPIFNALRAAPPDPISGQVKGGAIATDADHDDITYSATAGKGEVDINVNTGDFIYTPSDTARQIAGQPGAAGNDRRDVVTVTATDEYGATSTVDIPVVVAPAQNAVVDTVTLGSSPSRLIAGPNNTFYVLQGNSVVQINTVTGAVVRTVALGLTPSDIAISANGTIFASDPANNIEVKKFPASGASGEVGPFLQPTVLLIGPDGNELFVANNQVGTVSIVDATTGSATAPPAQSQSTFLQITDMVVTPDGKNLLGVMVDKRMVVVTFATHDASPLATAINDPSRAKLAVSLGGKVYVVDPTNDYMAVFTKGGVGYSPVDIPSPGAPSDVAVNSDTSRVYVANKLAGHVSVYNGTTNALVTTIPIGGSPDELEIDPTGTYLYVSDSTTKKVSIVRLAPTSTSV